MAATSPIRIDDELYLAAKAGGALLSRSAAQQVAHWARVGREVEASASISARDISRVLAGQADYDQLNSREQAVVRADWSDQLEGRLGDLDFAAEYSAKGETYSELNSKGRAVRRKPKPKA